MRRARALLLQSTLAFACFATAGCNLDNLGDPPPVADIYLPTGLLLSAQDASTATPARFLYLFNSNFDLRYNRGSVQAFNLDRLEEEVAKCAEPGIGCEIDSRSLLVDEVLIPSLVTSFDISPDRRRLYVATRTDPSMTFIDLDETTTDEENVLRCNDTDRRCSDARNRGADARSSIRDVTLPAEPVGMVTVPVEDGGRNTFVLVAHRTGQVSVFYDDYAQGPQLIQVLENLQTEPSGITFDPLTNLAYLSVYGHNGRIETRTLLRVGINRQAADPTRAYVFDAGYVDIDGVSVQRDTRAVVMNPAPDHEGEALVASREPSALLAVDVASGPNGAYPAFSVPAREITAVGAGPTRLALGQLGERHVVAVSCFDGHSVYVLDAATSDVLGIVHNLNGPFEVGIDSVRQRLYVADFRASSVQIIDISAFAQAPSDGEARTDPRILATLGIPKVVQELQ